jgi:hypothetical protein
MDIFNHLPYELRVLVNTFSAEHRSNMKEVLEELLYRAHIVYCMNENCERQICLCAALQTTIIGDIYYFCDEECSSYGEWSIRYDYRKSMRRQSVY